MNWDTQGSEHIIIVYERECVRALGRLFRKKGWKIKITVISVDAVRLYLHPHGPPAWQVQWLLEEAGYGWKMLVCDGIRGG